MNQSLPSTAEELFDECPRFRILTLGKAGVGKTALIKNVFKVEKLLCSDKEPGKCNIRDEIHSSENTRFVLHDCQGFEPGETDKFNKVKGFIQQRAQEPEIKDQLHAIWLCIQIPNAGDRLIEPGAVEFLKLPFGDVPVIVVFTHYDKIYKETLDKLGSSKLGTLEENQRTILVEQETEKYFRAEYADLLKQLGHSPKTLGWIKVSTRDDYQHTLNDLVQTTYKLIPNGAAESIRVALATAQRVDVDLKVVNTTRVGTSMKGYWHGLASSIPFTKKLIRECLDLIHKDIVKIWNFSDPGMILEDGDLKFMTLGLVQNLANPGTTNPDSGYLLAEGINFSRKLGDWYSGVYTNTPSTLRRLMGYIVDVTIVLEQLFWDKAAQPQKSTVSADDVEKVFGLYADSKEFVEQVHGEIQSYVDSMNLIDTSHPDSTHEEVERLIRAHRRNLTGAKKPAESPHVG
ncbi:hypothetical protein BD410DRAFT_900864 [Rickenella mellea]|uniref:G domain-containing protein n=1 Tax=Rickenella mellea TaxID=50990 RepID=A0A4Y7PSM5_9AGAM|nr:hypothetical protein BD410DRAFT_900864 [Rickenella mellea]